MWKICKIFKAVRSSQTFHNCVKTKAIFSSEKNQEDDEENKSNANLQNTSDILMKQRCLPNLHILNNTRNCLKYSQQPGQLKSALNIFSALAAACVYTTDFASVSSTEPSEQTPGKISSKDPKSLPPQSVKFSDSGNAFNPSLKHEVSTQTEIEGSPDKSHEHYHNFTETDESKNLSKAAHDMIGSFKNTIGLDLIRQQLYTEAFQQFKHAAYINNYPSAMFNLGLCFYKGYGAEKNENNAMEMWTKAADSGHTLAKYQVAVGYIRGLGGLPKNEQLALQYLDLATKSVDPSVEACALYGAILFKKGDYENAGFYLKKAKHRSPMATNILNKISSLSLPAPII